MPLHDALDITYNGFLDCFDEVTVADIRIQTDTKNSIQKH